MGSGVRRVGSASYHTYACIHVYIRVRPGPRERTSREMTAVSQRGNARETETSTTANTFGIPAKLRGSWQYETIEVAGTIRFANLASKYDVRKSKFHLIRIFTASFFYQRDSLILIPSS